METHFTFAVSYVIRFLSTLKSSVFNYLRKDGFEAKYVRDFSNLRQDEESESADHAFQGDCLSFY
jgi:hypothetical protein